MNRWRRNKNLGVIVYISLAVLAVALLPLTAQAEPPAGTGGNSTSTSSSSAPVQNNNATNNQTTPGMPQQTDTGYKGCYKDDYTPVANLDQQQCEGAGNNWVSGAGVNVGANCKNTDKCKKAVDKSRRDRTTRENNAVIDKRKNELVSTCQPTSKVSDCWYYNGDGKLYTSSSGSGAGVWSTLNRLYDDCRITTNQSLGDKFNNSDDTLAKYVGKDFRCRRSGTQDWYKCSITTTTANDTKEHVEFTCPSDNGTNTFKNATPMSSESISDMDKENAKNFSGDDDDTTCEQSLFGLGWILCPLKELIVHGIDGFMKWINDKLDVQILLGNSGATLKSISQSFIAYGNIVLTIVFIIMIYSMATSTGLSNYSVKTILPRLVIVAIAINLSFYICAILVDISNIAGRGMYGLLCNSALSNVAQDGAGRCNAMQDQSSVLDMSSILGGAGSVAVGIMMAILCLVIFGGGAIISFVIIIVCIEFREIALAVMTVISPVAIALYLLPNTQQWAQRWFKLYTQLLLVYPLFTGMLGATQLVGSLIINDNQTGVPNFLIALGCDIAPAIGVVPLFRASGGMIDKVAGLTQKYTQPVGDAAGKLARNNPLTRGAARVAGAGAGAITHTRIGDINGNRAQRFIGRKAGMASNTLQTFGRGAATEEAKVRSEAAARSDSAIDEMLANGRIDSRGLIGAEMIANKDVNMSRAAIRRAGKDKTIGIGDQRALMAATAARAADLQQHGRDTDARALLDDTANAIGDKYMGDQRSMEAFRNGQWGNNGVNAYDNAVNGTTAAMNATQASKQTEQQLQDRVRAINNQQSGNASQARNNMSNNVQQISADKKLQNNMDHNATQVLQGNFSNAWAAGQAADQPVAAINQAQSASPQSEPAPAPKHMASAASTAAQPAAAQRQFNNYGQPLPQRTTQGGTTYTLNGNGVYVAPGELSINKSPSPNYEPKHMRQS